MDKKKIIELLNQDLEGEHAAIIQYLTHAYAMGEGDDLKIKRLLKRILSDEEAYRGDFQHFVDKAKKEGAKDIRGSRQDETAQVLNWGIEHEYTVILQYLLSSYLTPNKEVKKEMEDQAINEMQHLGWLAEEMVDGGSSPRIEHTSVDRSQQTPDMLRAGIRIEKEVTEAYDRAAKKIKDPDLKKLLFRIRDHEIYHTDVFSDLLKEEEK